MPCRLTDNNAFVTRKWFVVVSCSVVRSVILKFMVVIDLCLTVILMRSVVSSISSLSTLVMNYQIANLRHANRLQKRRKKGGCICTQFETRILLYLNNIIQLC